MSIFNLLAIMLISFTGNFTGDIFIHRNGVNSYNFNFNCHRIKENDYLKIKIFTSKRYNKHKYIIPVKNIRVFSPFDTEIADSVIRTIDSTVIYISKAHDMTSFTLAYDTYQSAITTKDCACIFPFMLTTDPELAAKIDIYMPEDMSFNVSDSEKLIVNGNLIEYNGKNPNRLSNLYIKTKKSDIKENVYPVFAFFFSLMWAYLIPVLLVIFLYFYVNMGKYRKIPYIPDIVVYKPPKDLSPEEINFLLHDTLNLNGMVSLIFSLAKKGYIAIERVKNAIPFSKPDYKFTKIKDADENHLTEYELKVLKTLFPFPKDSSTFLSDKSTVLKRRYIELVGDISEHMAEEGYYDKDPMTKRVGIIILGIIIVLIGTVMLFFGHSHHGSIPFYQHHIEFSIILTGVIVALSNKYFSSRTVLGDYTLAEIKGFAEYFFRVERDNILNSTKNLLTDFYTTFATAMDYESKFLSEIKFYLSDRYKEKDGTEITDDLLTSNTSITF